MAEESLSNIFDAAARLEKDRLNKKKQEKASSEDDTLDQKKQDVDLDKIMQRAAQLRNEIDQKIAESFGQTGLGLKELQEYLDNPNNFSQKQWEAIQAQRAQVDNLLKNLLKQGPMKAKGSAPESEKAPGKGRKAQSLSAKKNWMPMK